MRSFSQEEIIRVNVGLRPVLFGKRTAGVRKVSSGFPWRNTLWVASLRTQRITQCLVETYATAVVAPEAASVPVLLTSCTDRA